MLKIDYISLNVKIFHFSPSNPIRRNTTRARGRSYKKDKVIGKQNLERNISLELNSRSFLNLQHANTTPPSTPNAVNVMPNRFRFEQTLKKQYTIF